MKETKIYQDPEHKNHQPLKNVYNAPFIQQGSINQWDFRRYIAWALLLPRRKYTETLQKKSRIKRTIICYWTTSCRLKNVDLLTLLLMKYSKSHFQNCSSKKRNCYRIDEEQMNVESQEAVQIFMIFWPIWRLFSLNHIKYEIEFY
jgi:hypothetical protein